MKPFPLLGKGVNNDVSKIQFRSSRLQMFFKIGRLKYFANFTGKHLCWSLFSIKSQAFRPGTPLKRDSSTGVFL